MKFIRAAITRLTKGQMEAKVETISINGTEYVPKNSVKDQNLSSDVRIVVLQRGWVYVGRFKKIDESEQILENAHCIRIWGTTKGLGELISGPTSSTKMDKSGTVRFHPLTVVSTLDCESGAWSKYV